MLSFSKSFIYCLENLLMPYCYAICKLQDFLLDLFGTAVELVSGSLQVKLQQGFRGG